MSKKKGKKEMTCNQYIHTYILTYIHTFSIKMSVPILDLVQPSIFHLASFISQPAR